MIGYRDGTVAESRRWVDIGTLFILLSGSGATGCYSETVLHPEDVPRLNGLRAGDTLYLASGHTVRVTPGAAIVVDAEPGHTLLFEGGHDIEAGDVILAREPARVSGSLLGAMYDAPKHTLTLKTKDGPYFLPYSASTDKVKILMPPGATEPRFARLILKARSAGTLEGLPGIGLAIFVSGLLISVLVAVCAGGHC